MATTQKFKKRLKILIISLSVLVALSALYVLERPSSNTLDYQTYESMLKSELFDKATIGKEYIYLQSQNAKFRIPKDLVDLKELSKKVPVQLEKDYEDLYDLALLALLALFSGYMLFYLQKQKSEPIPVKHQIQISPINEVEDRSFDIKPQVSSLHFGDVAGIEEVKEELEEIIDFLKDPKKYSSFGVRMPRGVLLVGPPGVGKTLIAKAVAGEAGVPFFYQSGSAFVQIYVGMGAKRVRELFAKAKMMAPSIIFIDEIDAVGKARGGLRNDEREATLNQLLTEMDGFNENSEVVVIGATNKIEVLDEALLRPGRFDRRIFVSLPNKEERAKILQIYLQKIPHHVDVEEIARMSVGFSGAALSSLVNEAALHALKQGKKIVTIEDFEAVKEKVIYGKKKVLSFSENERKVQATYQAAKALSSYWYHQEFDKISLIGASIKDLDKEILSKQEYLAKIKVLLSGYVALEELYKERFSISSEDVKRAKILAEEMVTQLAMGDRIFADVTDTARIVEDALEELRELIASKKEQLVQLRDMLLQKEQLSKDEVKKVMDALF